MNFRALALGALGGAAAAGAAWVVIDRLIDKRFEREALDLIDAARPRLRKEIRTELEREIPDQVKKAIDDKLSSYGITPETGRQIASVLDTADNWGLIGLRGQQ